MEQVSVQHFRSFGDEVKIGLKPGLNVIVGPNGSGKSNVIDSLLFALAQDSAALKTRAWSDLAHRGRRGPPMVRLQLSSTAAASSASGGGGGGDSLTLLARIREDGARTLSVDGRVATLQQARDALSAAGLDTDASFFVRQGVAGAVLSGAEVPARCDGTRGPGVAVTAPVLAL